MSSGPRRGSALRLRIWFLWLGMMASGCASAPEPVLRPSPEHDLSGLASWYGHPHHGRTTANGERYDMNMMTAAHRTLPFNTVVRVERLDQGGTVDVRINDRGPFIEGRVIDLSRASAEKLDMIGVGVAPVRLIPLRLPADRRQQWVVLVGQFAREEDARKFSGSFQARWKDIRVVASGSGRYFHLQLQGFKERDEARAMLGRLHREGYTAFLATIP